MNSLHRLVILLAACAIWLGMAASASAALGFRRLAVPNGDAAPIEAGVWYPASGPVQTMQLGLFQQSVAVDAPMAGEALPLVLISHGNGGAWSSHVDTAVALAEAGFVVVALTHPGDNYLDQSRSTDLPARPRHLRAVLDYLLGSWSERARIDAARIGAFGFSAGGFTVIAAAGAEADPAAIVRHCEARPELFDCRLMSRSPVVPGDWLQWSRDDRIKAVVAAAPGLGYAFTDRSVAAVRIPVQLWQAEEDEVLAAPYHVEPLRDRLPSAEYHPVAGAGHFDFLSPCRPEVAAAEPALCGSGPGFDRTAFHAAFNAEVVRFFRKALGG